MKYSDLEAVAQAMYGMFASSSGRNGDIEVWGYNRIGQLGNGKMGIGPTKPSSRVSCVRP